MTGWRRRHLVEQLLLIGPSANLLQSQTPASGSVPEESQPIPDGQRPPVHSWSCGLRAKSTFFRSNQQFSRISGTSKDVLGNRASVDKLQLPHRQQDVFSEGFPTLELNPCWPQDDAGSQSRRKPSSPRASPSHRQAPLSTGSPVRRHSSRQTADLQARRDPALFRGSTDGVPNFSSSSPQYKCFNQFGARGERWKTKGILLEMHVIVRRPSTGFNKLSKCTKCHLVTYHALFYLGSGVFVSSHQSQLHRWVVSLEHIGCFQYPQDSRDLRARVFKLEPPDLKSQTKRRGRSMFLCTLGGMKLIHDEIKYSPTLKVFCFFNIKNCNNCVFFCQFGIFVSGMNATYQ